jgi:transcriptional regulator
MRIVDDPAWLLQQIGAMTDAQETARPEPWSVTDAPAPFVAAQLKGIVGVEIEIARIEGKWKVSQNRSEADRQGVAAGLRLAPDDAAQRMAELVDARGALPGA